MTAMHIGLIILATIVAIDVVFVLVLAVSNWRYQRRRAREAAAQLLRYRTLEGLDHDDR